MGVIVHKLPLYSEIYQEHVIVTRFTRNSSLSSVLASQPCSHRLLFLRQLSSKNSEQGLKVWRVAVPNTCGAVCSTDTNIKWAKPSRRAGAARDANLRLAVKCVGAAHSISVVQLQSIVTFPLFDVHRVPLCDWTYIHLCSERHLCKTVSNRDSRPSGPSVRAS
ncbi:hypothetical protein J6590_027598 [Homalodisca vitripennis]|nr:hypothetical protein J6590_027598 [Homalodisca vitripennis]